MVLNYNKANSVFESMTILVVLVAFAIVTIFSYGAFKDINADIQADGMLSNDNKQILQNIESNYTNYFDYVPLFIYIMFTVGAAVSAYFIESNPGFFALMLILLVVVFVVSAMLNNVFFETFAASDLVLWPMTSWLFNNILKLIVLSGFLIGVALYAKR